MSAAIAERRMRDKEAYDAFELERRLTDEVTGATESIAVPMRNTFRYELGPGDDLWYQGENIRELLDATIALNEEIVLSRPEFMTELIRNYIERTEYDAQVLLANGSEDDPNLLVVMTPIPDAVLAGVDLGAYDPVRKKMLVRVYTRTCNGIEATSLSLDGSDRAGMEAIAAKFGQEIPLDATSEDILAMRLWGDTKDFDDVVSDVRKLYDTSLTDRYGGFWYAGRRDQSVKDAMAFVCAQQDLLDEHMAIINAIHDGGDAANRKKKLKTARYNFAAALSRRLRGETDAVSIGDAGDRARAAGEVYRSDCPEADEVTAAQSLHELGLTKKMTCPFCGFATYGDPCAEVLTCNECAASVAKGTVVSKGIGRSGVYAKRRERNMPRPAAKTERPNQKQRLEAAARAKFGAGVIVRTEISFLTAYRNVYDGRSKQLLGRL